MKNIENMQGMTARGGVLRALIALGALCFTTQAAAQESQLGDLILNEWNAVGPNTTATDRVQHRRVKCWIEQREGT